jgi:adenosylcobinamide-GDP ribazoletransferase
LTISVAFLLAAPAAWAFPYAALGTLGAMLGFSWFAARRLAGGLTGDCYGAAIVLGELFGLLLEQVVRGL